jgi:hypothetical protein
MKQEERRKIPFSKKTPPKRNNKSIINKKIYITRLKEINRYFFIPIV